MALDVITPGHVADACALARRATVSIVADALRAAAQDSRFQDLEARDLILVPVYAVADALFSEHMTDVAQGEQWANFVDHVLPPAPPT